METPDKKTAILKAASSCFARYGYEKTTLDDIGRQVGLNKASLYYYYKNKESIYTEVIYKEAEEFLTRVFREVDAEPLCRDKVLVYLAGRVRYVQEAVNLGQLSAESLQKLTPLFSEMYGRVVDKEINLLADILDRCVKSGDIIPCDTPRVAKSIITLAEAVMSRLGVCSERRTEENCNMAIEELSYTASLIIEGLKAGREAKSNNKGT